MCNPRDVLDLDRRDLDDHSLDAFRVFPVELTKLTRVALQDLGLDAGGMRPEELGALVRSDIPRLGKIVRDSGAKID